MSKIYGWGGFLNSFHKLKFLRAFLICFFDMSVPFIFGVWGHGPGSRHFGFKGLSLDQNELKNLRTFSPFVRKFGEFTYAAPPYINFLGRIYVMYPIKKGVCT